MILFQRIESAAILVATLALYYYFGGSWGWFLAMILVPDLSLVGYLKDPKIGALIYNLGHSYLGPVLCLLVSTVMGESTMGLMASMIWTAHIAGDRVLGFGLKSPTGFKDTHLGRLR